MSHEEEVAVRTKDAVLDGMLSVPSHTKGIVVFAHGSGSSRFSQRNRYVAQVLNKAGLATLLFDLLTSQESDIDEVTGAFRFDIPLLAARLADTVDWLASADAARGLPIGLFGASTGAAAALIAASERPERVRVVVSRGGRPDLAGTALGRVHAPTLLIVGSRDPEVLALNEQAARRLSCEHALRIVHGATHLFEEPGTLEAVARLATDWFIRHLTESNNRPPVAD